MIPARATESYCGPAPVPGDLMLAWNFDVYALALIGAIVVAHVRWGDPGKRQQLRVATGLMALLFISPLCALTVSLFSARVAHHVMLIAVVSPLLAAAFPEPVRARRRLPLEWVVGIHALTIWFWHAPQAYSIGIGSAPAYWAMQLSLLGTGVLMWRQILSPRTETGAAMLALLATVVHMGMLGALLTFAQNALYEPHFATTLPYGLTPRDDQQLGGLVMWVPAALPYLVVALVLFSARFERQAGTASR